MGAYCATEGFSPEAMQSKSAAAANLCTWVVATYSFNRIYVKVKLKLPSLPYPCTASRTPVLPYCLPYSRTPVPPYPRTASHSPAYSPTHPPTSR